MSHYIGQGAPWPSVSCASRNLDLLGRPCRHVTPWFSLLHHAPLRLCRHHFRHWSFHISKADAIQLVQVQLQIPHHRTPINNRLVCSQGHVAELNTFWVSWQPDDAFPQLHEPPQESPGADASTTGCFWRSNDVNKLSFQAVKSPSSPATEQKQNCEENNFKRMIVSTVHILQQRCMCYRWWHLP